MIINRTPENIGFIMLKIIMEIVIIAFGLIIYGRYSQS